MTRDQRNKLEAGLHFIYWTEIVGILVCSSITVLSANGWTDWNLLFFASELLLMVCAYPKLVRLDQVFARYVKKKCGYDS